MAETETPLPITEDTGEGAHGQFLSCIHRLKQAHSFAFYGPSEV